MYYVGDASRDMNEFTKFLNENVKRWRDVEQLCLHCDLDEERWIAVQCKYMLPKSVLLAKRDRINWKRSMVEYEKFTDEMVRELKDHVDFGNIALFARHVTEACLREFHDRLDMHLVSRCRDLSDEFLYDFRDSLCWSEITWRRLKSNGYVVDDAFLDRFADFVDWVAISEYARLDSRQLEKYADRLDWMTVSIYRKWTVGEMARFRDRIEWDFIERNGNWHYTPLKCAEMRREAFRVQ